MRVEALELGRVARAADAGVERGTVIGARAPRRERASDAPLRSGRLRQIRRQLRARRDRGAPALDTPARLEARDRRDQVAAGEVVGGRERRSRVVVRLLLGDGREAERAAGGDAAERPGAPADLALDDVAIVHAAKSNARLEQGVAAWRCRRCQAAMPLTMKSRSPGLT